MVFSLLATRHVAPLKRLAMMSRIVGVSWNPARASARVVAPSGVSCRAAEGGNEVDLEADQIRGQFPQSLDLPLSRSMFEGDAPPLDITEFPQPLPERADQLLHHRRSDRRDCQAAHAGDAGSLSKSDARPPEQRATEKRDDIPSSHALRPCAVSAARRAKPCDRLRHTLPPSVVVIVARSRACPTLRLQRAATGC
jgi:hypothetical protein